MGAGGARHGHRRGGAIAAGHPVSARVGADVLARGGNACDALVAAVIASWVAEPTVSGACGGGFVLYRDGASGRSTLLDCFVATPGIALQRPARAMDSFDVHFGTAVQAFHIGAGSCGVPGTAAGVGEVHRRFGSLPWADLVAPAVELARAGVTITPAHARLHSVLVPVVTATPGAREIWAPDGRVLDTGDLMRQPRLAATLERLADAGAQDLYRGGLAREIARFMADEGGAVTAEDLQTYRVVSRRPVEIGFRGHRVITNPPPSSGGVLLAYSLGLHDSLPPVADPVSATAIRHAAAVLREAERLRSPAFARRLARGGARAIIAPPALAAGRRRVEAALGGAPSVPAFAPTARGTSHVSVVDLAGNAASMTSSTGCGSGVFVADTGLHLNNMLGEEDLTGHHVPRAGSRLTSMMSPTIATGRDGRLIVAGSSGSARIRSAMHRVLVGLIENDLSPAEAIELPRIHVGPGGLDCEPGFPEATLAELEAMGEPVVRWPDRSLYFGGAQIAVSHHGLVDAAGDPRRGGDAVTVLP
jgi:gamma-glutamyltranspeptidase/glutathione hydrolase